MNAAGAGSSSTGPTLSYSRESRGLWRPSLVQFALACATIPLACGLIVFASWMLTGWRFWMPAGAAAVVLGLFAVIAGSVASALSLWRMLQSGPATRSQAIKHTVLVGLLFAAGLVVATLCIATAIKIEGSYVVTVVNGTSLPITAVSLTGPQFGKTFGPIAPGARAACLCDFIGDGSLDVTITQPGSKTGGAISGYVTHNMGGDEIVTVSAPMTLTTASATRSPFRKWLDLP